MADLVNMAISSEASAFADQLMEGGLFRDQSDVLNFAAAYMIKHHFDEFSPASYVLTDTRGSNHAFSAFDPDGKMAIMIRALYPDTDTPYLLLRALMDKGLLVLKEDMAQDSSLSIIDEIS